MESAKEQVETPKKSVISKIPRHNWAITTYILGVLLIFLVINNGGITGKTVSESKASDGLVSYLNSQVGGGVTYVSSKSDGSLYEITVSYQGQEIPLYVTKDGKYFVQGVAPLTASTSTTNTASTSAEIPKSDKPKIELFVMSFCPYGVQAEQLMKPVYDLLKDKADFNIKFIVNVGGTTLDSVQSLHGALEAQENARQVCINKYYPDKLWDYITEIDNTCYPTYSKDIDICWKKAAAKFSIDTAKIENCLKSEAVTILKEHEGLTDKYGVSGSPTIVINGAMYSGGRSADAFKQAICSAFNNAPAECEKTLSTASGAAAGNC